MSQRYKGDGLVVLAVNAWDEPTSEVKRFVKKQKLEHRILLEGGKVAKNYGVKLVPTVFWIDPAGTIVDAEVGFDSPESLEKRTSRLLARGS